MARSVCLEACGALLLGGLLAACARDTPVPTSTKHDEPIYSLQGINKTEAAEALLTAYQKLNDSSPQYGLDVDAQDAFSTTSVVRDEYGKTTCRLQQVHHGMKVLDHEALVQVDNAGNAKIMAIRFLRNMSKIAINPSLSESGAKVIVEKHVRRDLKDTGHIQIEQPKLVIWTVPPESAELSYEVLVQRGLERDLIYVGARAGTVLGQRTLSPSIGVGIGSNK